MASPDRASIGTFPPANVARQFAESNMAAGLMTADAPRALANAAANNNAAVPLPNRRVGAESNDPVNTIDAAGLKSAFKLAGGLFIFAIVWIVLGVAAFIMSLVCFSKSGSKGGQNVIGLLLAMFLGPFYWLYYIGGGSYCTNRIASGVGLAA
jgi:hypothetical protein